MFVKNICQLLQENLFEKFLSVISYSKLLIHPE